MDKMVSRTGFRILGYVYAIFGTVLSIFSAFTSGILIASKDENHLFYIVLACSLLNVVFYTILLFGISQKNRLFVIVHQIFLIVSSALIFMAWLLGIVAVFVIVDSSDQTKAVIVSLIVCGVASAFYIGCIWIVSGVLRYIDHERESVSAVRSLRKTIKV